MALKIVRFNVEGISLEKADILSGMKEDIMCCKRHAERQQHKAPWHHIAANIKSNIYGSTMLLHDKRLVENTAMKHSGTVEPIRIGEMLTRETGKE